MTTSCPPAGAQSTRSAATTGSPVARSTATA